MEGIVQSKVLDKENYFSAFLPLSAEKPEEVSAKPTQDKIYDEKKVLRVLVVDDNEESVQTLAWAVEIFGHKVAIARNGVSALQQGYNFLPQVVLLDIGMPGINGYEVCQSLKRIPELENTLFIAQTGWDQKQHQQLSYEAGFDYHLVKPVDLKVLAELIATRMKE